MRPGPFGVAIPPWIDALRDPAGPAPRGFRSWRFHFCSPPYRSLGKPLRADELAEAGMRVEPGAFLVADAGAPHPDEVPPDLTWIQETVPWCALVLQVDLAQREAVEELVRRMARRGITVLPREDSDPASMARLIVRTTDPVGEVESALRMMLPRTDSGTRAETAAQIQAGLRAALDPEGPAGVGAGQDRRIFFRVGRALGAAVRLQGAERGTSNLSVAYQAGYASGSSLETSMERTLGRRPGHVRGTVGWRWLLWLALLREEVRPRLRPARGRKSG